MVDDHCAGAMAVSATSAGGQTPWFGPSRSTSAMLSESPSQSPSVADIVLVAPSLPPVLSVSPFVSLSSSPVLLAISVVLSSTQVRMYGHAGMMSMVMLIDDRTVCLT